MANETFSPHAPLRLAASLLLAGQLSHIAVTQFHTGGHANGSHNRASQRCSHGATSGYRQISLLIRRR